eukprot:Polyplicarium_translucidae@DN3566_c0_g1_i1.p2
MTGPFPHTTRRSWAALVPWSLAPGLRTAADLGAPDKLRTYALETKSGPAGARPSLLGNAVIGQGPPPALLRPAEHCSIASSELAQLRKPQQKRQLLLLDDEDSAIPAITVWNLNGRARGAPSSVVFPR